MSTKKIFITAFAVNIGHDASYESETFINLVISGNVSFSSTTSRMVRVRRLNWNFGVCFAAIL